MLSSLPRFQPSSQNPDWWFAVNEESWCCWCCLYPHLPNPLAWYKTSCLSSHSQWEKSNLLKLTSFFFRLRPWVLSQLFVQLRPVLLVRTRPPINADVSVSLCLCLFTYRFGFNLENVKSESWILLQNKRRLKKHFSFPEETWHADTPPNFTREQ